MQEKKPEQALELLERRRSPLNARAEALLEAEGALQLGDGARAKQEAQRALKVELSQGPRASAQTLLCYAEAEILLGDVLASIPHLDGALALGGAPSTRLVGRLLRMAPRQARALLERADAEGALRVMGLLLALAPTAAPLTLYAQALFARAQDHERNGDAAAALADYLLAAPTLPFKESSEAWLAAGGLYLQEKNLREAEAAFTKSLAATRPDEIIRKTEYIAKRYADWGEPAYAARLYEGLAEKNASPHYWRLTAESFVLAERLEDAERAYEAYIVTNYDKAEAAREVATSFKKRGDLARWEKYARIAIQSTPKRFRERAALCDVWAEQGRLDKVKQEFEDYLEVIRKGAGDLVNPYTEIANWYVKKGLDDEAILAFESAKKAGARPSQDLAEAYGRLKRFTEMKATLDACIAAASDKRRERLLAAKKLAGVGEYLVAVSLAQEVFTADPSQRDAAMLLADLLYSQGDSAAEEKLLSAHAAASKDPIFAWLEVGGRYLRRGDKPRAERAFIAAAGKGSRDALLKLGDLYLSSGNKSKARETFQRYVDTATELEKYKALNEILRHYPATTESEERARLLQEITKRYPDKGTSFLTLATESLQSGNLTAAAEAFEGYVKAEPNNQAKNYQTVGDLYNNAGYLYLAEEAYEKALSSYPSNGEGLYQKGLLASDLNRGALALAYFEEYRRLPERTPRELYVIGELLQKRGRCAVALPFYEDSLAADPHQNDARLGLARCALSIGALSQASASFALLPQDPTSLLDIGRSYRELGYEALALPYLEGAFLQNSYNFDSSIEPIGLYELVLTLKEIGQGERLPEIAKQLLDLCPRNAGCYGLHLGLAKAYKELDRPKARLYHLEQANRARPSTTNGSSLYNQIAETLLLLGESRRARDYYQKAAHLASEPGQLLFNNAEALYRRGELGLARELYLSAATYQGKHESDARLAAGVALYFLGARRDALQELNELGTSKQDAETWERVARSLLRCEEAAKAAEAFEESLNLSANPGPLYIELAALRLSLGETSRALRLLREYLREAPPPREQLKIAKTFSEAGFHSEALQLYQQLIPASEPTESLEAFQRASALLIQQREPAALQELVASFLAAGVVDRARALLESGRALSKLALHTEATGLFQALLALPVSESLAFEAIDELIKLGLLEEALSQYRRFSQQKANPVPVLSRAADRSPEELALRLLDEAISLAPNKADLYEKQAALLLLRGQAIEATNAYLQAITLSPSPSASAKEAIKALCERGSCGLAASFLRFIEEPAARSFWEATIEANQQQDPSASLRKFLAQSPPKKATQEAAKLALEAGQLSAASQLFQQSEQLDLTSAALSLWLDATILQEQYNLTALSEKALQSTGHYAEKQALLQVLLSRGEAEAVLPLARSLSAERPWESKTLQLTLTALVAVSPKGWEKEALSYAEQYSHSRAYEEARALLFAAELLLKLGAVSPASSLFERALQQSPEDHQIYVSLGKLKLIQGDQSAANELFSKAVAASPSPELLWAQLGDLYRAATLYELALQAYQQANHSGNQTQGLYEKIAEVRLLSGDLPGAQEALLQGVEQSASPEQEIARFALRLLAEHGAAVLEPLSSLLGARPASPEIKTAQLTLRAVAGDERPLNPEELSPSLQQSVREALKQSAPNSKLAKLFSEGGSPQPLYRAFWTQRANLWSKILSRSQLTTSTEQLSVLWSEALCSASTRSCAGVIATTPSSQLLALALSEAAAQSGQRRLAKLALHLSPSMGEGAYPVLITSALQAGDKATAAQLAQEWRRSAISSGEEVPRALFAVAISQSAPDLNALRLLLLEAEPELASAVRKLLFGGTFPLSW